MSSPFDQQQLVDAPTPFVPPSRTDMPSMEWVPSAQNTIRKRKWDADAAINMAMLELASQKATIEELNTKLEDTDVNNSNQVQLLKQQIAATQFEARNAVDRATVATQNINATQSKADAANAQILAFTSWLRDSPEATIAIPSELVRILSNDQSMLNIYNLTSTNVKWSELSNTVTAMKNSGLYTGDESNFVERLYTILTGLSNARAVVGVPFGAAASIVPSRVVAPGTVVVPASGVDLSQVDSIYNAFRNSSYANMIRNIAFSDSEDPISIAERYNVLLAVYTVAKNDVQIRKQLGSGVFDALTQFQQRYSAYLDSLDDVTRAGYTPGARDEQEKIMYRQVMETLSLLVPSTSVTLNQLQQSFIEEPLSPV